ncbi:DUF1194 domain-containing protein [Desertibaculum subflavum]|uniref:DUF1194 domain-containing protein n=1 Tax=Desertibaculum subflavum TaxID=2268458 RepID=UPI0013C529AA
MTRESRQARRRLPVARRLLSAVALAALLAGTAAAAERVTAAVVLAVDVSGSVDAARYEVQRAGIAAVFTDPAIQQAAAGGLAVAVIEWSDGHAVVIPWTILRSHEDALALAARIRRIKRTPGVSTELSLAMLAAADLLDQCPCAPDQRVIDISGDGPNNGPVSTWIARDQVVARGITVNGLPIVTPAEPDLADWYAREVVGGEGAILEVAQGFEDFARAMRQKFAREISARPASGPERPVLTNAVDWRVR